MNVIICHRGSMLMQSRAHPLYNHSDRIVADGEDALEASGTARTCWIGANAGIFGPCPT